MLNGGLRRRIHVWLIAHLSCFRLEPVCISLVSWHADMPTESKEQVEAAARSVQGKGVDIVLAKLGTKGSMLIQKDEILHQGILNADKVCLLSLMLLPTNPETSILTHKRHPYTGNLNRETSG